MLTPLVISLIVAFILIQAAILATTIYLHRSATHGSLELHPSVEVFFRAAVWILTGITTREWVAVHRKHHAFTDQEGDPHSPLLAGFWSVQIGNVFHYQREARKQEVLDTFAKDIKNDWWERTFFSSWPSWTNYWNCNTVFRSWNRLGPTYCDHSRSYLRFRPVFIYQRPVSLSRLQKLRKHRYEYSLSRALLRW